MTGKRQERKAAFASSVFGAVWGDFLCALGFLTRLPLPAGSAAHGRPLGAASWAFPLIGVVVGLIAGAVLALADAVGVPALPAALLALGTSAVLTGALHEDGLADSVDGLWGASSPQARLDIMRDSRIGGFGALGLIIATGLKASALAAVISGAGAQAAWLALIGAAIAGRGVLPGVMHLMARARETGLGAMAGRPSAARAVVAGAIAALTLPLLLGPDAGPAAVLLGLLVAGKGALVARWKIKGYTGDILGAIEQAVEIAVLLCAAAALSWHAL
jgi:adenosylcobinamide-GDP ribazoletransferase